MTIQEDSSSLTCVCTKTEQTHGSTRPLEWALTGTVVQTERKLQVALFSTKLFTEESDFFFSSQMKAPINVWFTAFQPSGVLKAEKTFFPHVEAGMMSKCQLLHFLLRLEFFKEQVTKQ